MHGTAVGKGEDAKIRRVFLDMMPQPRLEKQRPAAAYMVRKILKDKLEIRKIRRRPNTSQQSPPPWSSVPALPFEPPL